MSAIPSQLPVRDEQADAAFLDYLPAVETRAAIKFRNLPEHDRGLRELQERYTQRQRPPAQTLDGGTLWMLAHQGRSARRRQRRQQDRCDELQGPASARLQGGRPAVGQRIRLRLLEGPQLTGLESRGGEV